MNPLPHTGHAQHLVPPETVPTDLRFEELVPTAEQVAGVLHPPHAAPKPTLLLRKNEAHLTAAEQQAFKDAVTVLIDDGTYAGLVEQHDRNLAQHTVMAHVPPRSMYSGAMRFLPWHRVYLMRFEEALRAVDATVTVPYWEWTRTRKIPEWIADWEPNGITRTPGTPQGLPPRQDIWLRLQTRPYALFTLLLEGWSPQVSTDPRGISPLGAAHNLVHVWVGGDMANVPSAPKDPLFWLHHAEVDRLWHIWQQAQPGDHPVFLPHTDAVMDPWPESYADVADIRAVGYHYEEETFDA